jgi:tetratricopeptide (TPR) repeat protein
LGFPLQKLAVKPEPSMTRGLVAIAAALFVIAGLSPSSAADCSESQLETDPKAVEGACTVVIEAADTAADQKYSAYYIRGRGYHRTGRLRQARLDYDAAINIDPGKGAVFVDMGDLALRADRLAQATAYAKRALDLEPDSARAHAFRAATFGAGRKWDEAIAEANAALAIDAAEPFALIARLMARKGKKDFAPALADAETLVGMDPKRLAVYGFVDDADRPADFHAAAILYRASVYEAQGDAAKAEADYNAAVAAKAEPNTFVWRATFLMKQPGREEDALRDFRSTASLDPTNAFNPFSIGRVLAGLHRYPDALKSLDRALWIYPYYAEAFMLRSHVKNEMGEIDGGYDDQMAALTLDPTLIWPAIDRLRSLGYYQGTDLPRKMTPVLADAVKACWIDPECRQADR